MKTRFIAALLITAFAGSAYSQLTLPRPQFTAEPLPARIGQGEGTVFSVRARIDPPHSLLGYQWLRDGLPIPGERSEDYRIDGASAAHAGQISVRVYSTGLNRTTSTALLEVVNKDWAPLAGRPLSTAAAPHQPALIRCGGPLVLAWVERVGPFPGVATLRVSRYDGAVWAPLDWATLPGSAAHHASDPALSCARFQDRDWIVAAWTESAVVNGPKTLHVKRFDDARWQAVGAALLASPTVSPSRPVLRLAAEESDNSGGSMVARGSLRAYLNAGRMRYERWDGLQWVVLGDGTPHTGAAPAVALDTMTRPTAQGRALAPLQLANHRTGSGQSQLGVTSSQTLWLNLGNPLAAVTGTPHQIVGLGIAALNGQQQAVAVWRNGTGPWLESALFAGQDYLDAFTTPNPPAARNWQPYANPRRLNVGPFSAAFDDEAYRGNCGDRRSFSLALADASTTRVLRADCVGSQSMAWVLTGAVLPSRPATMALKMQDFDHPVLAWVESGAIQVRKWIAVP